MNINEYQNLNQQTMKPHHPLDAHHSELLDWSLGLAGEAGEVCDIIKHQIFHREDCPRAELAKELGDVLWYVAAIATSMGIPMSVIMELNRAKLTSRYKAGYSDEESANRKKSEFSIEGTFEELMKAYVISEGENPDV